MSIKLMSLVWDHFPDGGSQMLVMLKMADWANDNGGSLYPSISKLAEKTRLSDKQARRRLHRLIESGFISVVGNLNGGPPGTTRNYQINVNKLMETAPASGRAPIEGRAPASVPDGSLQCPETAPAHGSQSISYPPVSTSITDDVKINGKHRKLSLDDFNDVLIQYPKRSGANPKKKAEKALNARLKEGIDIKIIEAGVKRYKAFCEATGKIGTEYIMQAATFLGPDRHFENQWEIPKVEKKADIEKLAAQHARPGESLDQFKQRWAKQRAN